MFKSPQVITSNVLRKRFADISRELEYEPQAVLITQKNRGKLVLVNAEIFEDLLDFRYNIERSERQQPALRGS